MVLTIVAAAAVLVGLVLIAIGGRPGAAPDVAIDGAVSHDFGVFVLEAPIELEHTFVLTNRSGATRHVKRTLTTCGCTKAQVSHEVIEPGATFQVTAQLRLSAGGVKREEVAIIFQELEPFVLVLRAAGRTLDAFYAGARTIDMDASAQTRVLLVMLRRDDLSPGAIDVQAPSGIRAVINEWVPVLTSNGAVDGFTRWHAWLTVERIGEHVAQEAQIILTDELKRSRVIALDGLPSA